MLKSHSLDIDLKKSVGIQYTGTADGSENGNQINKIPPISFVVSQIFPSGTRERPAEPPQAATPGAAGAAGGALVHPQRLPERSPLAQPLCTGAD